jgi:hypothetical protein
MRVPRSACWVLGILTIAAVTPRLRVQGDSVEGIFAAWEHRREDVRSLRCVMTGKRLSPKNAYAPFAHMAPELKGQVIPAQDESHPLRCAIAVDFVKGYVRNEEASYILDASSKQFKSYENVYYYDGTLVRRLERRAKNTDEANAPSKWQPELFFHSEESARAHFFLHSEYPVFFACGILAATDDMSSGTLRLPPYRDFLRRQGEGRIGDRDCIILRTVPEAGVSLYRDYWVDSTRGGAILRYTVSAHDQVTGQMDIEYEEGQPGGWRPKRWVETMYQGGSMFRAEHLEVTEWELNPKISTKEFQVELSPGMVIFDNRNNIFFKVDLDGQTLNELFRTPGGRMVEIVAPRRS